MNQKVTLRFADHVLTFTLTETKVSEVERHFRRKWLYEFTRADGDFIVNFDKVLWMKISPGDDTEAKVAWETRALEQPFAFAVDTAVSTSVVPDGGEYGSL